MPRLETPQHVLEDAPRIAGEGLSIGIVDVTEKTGAAPLRLTPGEDGVRRRIRDQAHVALLDPSETLHRRAIEPNAVLQRRLQPLHRDIRAFEDSRDISELQTDELDVVLPHALQDVIHRCLPP